VGHNSDQRAVHRVVAAKNVAPSTRAKRFSIDPNEFIRAEEEAKRSNLALIGFYHSHPDAPVEPSRIDFENAWPKFTYIVISLQNGEPRDVGAWSLNQAATGFELDELKVF